MHTLHTNTPRGGSRAAATSKMEHFVIIVNGFQPLTTITKRSIMDVATALDPPLYTKSLVRIHPNNDFKDIKCKMYNSVSQYFIFEGYMEVLRVISFVALQNQNNPNYNVFIQTF